MAEEFDAYYRWLGIAPNEQPPHHYRLLGINVFETDAEVIADAIERQMTHVRKYHLGPQQDLSQKILNEIAAAKACLLDPKKKAAYDAQLRQKLAQPSLPIPDVIKRIGDARLEQFVQHVMQSGLLTAAEISSYYESLPPEKQPRDAQSLARALVKANKLTKYQAELVYQGKTKGVAFGDYRVLDKLGEGGMGVVLKAQHQRMDRTVAVKMISGATLKSPDAVKRFYREVKAAAKLNHSNIVTAYDAGEHEGGHYLVMEYVEGKDLAAILNEKGPLPVAQAVDYIVQAARGLQYAHEQSIVHRDIKPANLLVDKKGTVKILDMGLARVVGLGDTEGKEQLTASGQVMGTCDYMAPEQAMDTHHVDARADIYSLGCTLYRLLTGEALYKGDSLAKILISHQMSPVPSLCKARPDVLPQLDAVFQKMVAKKSEERYSSMTAVMDALETSSGAPLLSRGAERSLVGRGAGGEGVPKGAGETSPAVATGTKKKVEKLAEATIAHQAAAAETSKQLGSDEKLLTVPRKKKTLAIAIGGGLLGAIGIVVLAITISVHHPDGTKTSVTVPNGSNVTVNEKGDMDVAVPAGSPRPPAGEGQGVRAVGSAPSPAAAPFDEKEAKEHQVAWAKYLGVPVEMTNEIGMKLALIPPGEFDMGSTPEEIAAEIERRKKNREPQGYLDRMPAEEGPRHRVKISKPFYLAMYQVTQGEYEKVMGVNPSAFTEKQVEGSAFNPPLGKRNEKRRAEEAKQVAGKDTAHYPVETVNWDDAMEFCCKLSAMPTESSARRVYRLPTEAEWEYACRAGTTTRWYSGDDEAGLADAAWFNKNAGAMTHPVGEKKPNAWGLYDMSGNVYQWCSDWFSADYYKQSPLSDPVGPPTGSPRVLRGGHSACLSSFCRSAHRAYYTPTSRDPYNGFRVVAEVVAKEQEQATTPTAPSTTTSTQPPLAKPTMFAIEAANIQKQWAEYLGVPVEVTNSIGMNLVLIPPGEFEMGSTPDEVQWALEYAQKNKITDKWYLERVPSEGPRHHVKITKPFYAGMYQVTQGEYEKVMGVNPSAFIEKQVAPAAFKPPLPETEVKHRVDDRKKVVGKDTSRHPVDTVNWDEAMKFCHKLSAMPAERAARRVYRLPTEAEWEYTCRAGTTTRWHCGDEEAGLVAVEWFNKNSGETTHPVGQKRPNAWGLYDMSGNVYQWCSDWFSADSYKQSPPSDPIGPPTGSARVVRGGAWGTNASGCRSAYRHDYEPASHIHSRGFRVVVGR